MAYERQTGKLHPVLRDAPELPEGCEQLWNDFIHLHRRRGSNGFEPSLITDVQIDAWQRVNKVSLPAWQVDTIFAADDAFLTYYASTRKKA